MRSLCVTFLVALVGAAPTAGAAQGRPEIRVWTARALATVLAEIGQEFERTTGYRLQVTSDLPPALDRRARAGELFDVFISVSTTVDDWIRQGRLIAASRTDISRSGIGVEVRAGAPKPDVSTVEAFRNTLLAAKSIAYLRVGSGIYMANLAERLGIAEAIQAKVTRPETDIVSEMVARGEVELGIVVITQILTTPGVTLVGPLPAEVQSHIMFTAGIGKESNVAAAARQLIAFLTGTVAGSVIRKQGMEPASSAGIPAQPSQSELQALLIAALQMLTSGDPAQTLCIRHHAAAGVVDADSSLLAQLGSAQQFRRWSACSMDRRRGLQQVFTKADELPATLVEIFAPVFGRDGIEALLSISLIRGGRSGGLWECTSVKNDTRWSAPRCVMKYQY